MTKASSLRLVMKIGLLSFQVTRTLYSLAFRYDRHLVALGLEGVLQVCSASSGTLKCVLDSPGGGIEV